MKKFLAFICMSVFLLESTYNVYATEPNVVISEVIYDEVIDVDELIQLGIEQYRGKPMTRSDTEKDSLTVTQVLGEKEYANGEKERTICISEIAIMDQDGKQLTERAIAYSSGHNYGEEVTDGVTLICTIYATMKISDIPSADMVTFRCDRVTSTIVREGNIYPETGTTEYYHIQGNEHQSAPFTATMASGTQVYTLNVSGGNFYVSSSIPVMDGLVGQSSLRLSNGHQMNVQAGVAQDDPFAVWDN